MRDIIALALYSRDQLKALRAETAIEYDHLERGILHVYTVEKEFAGAIEAAKVMCEFGCERKTISADECVVIEPALKNARPLLVGGDYTAADESGDAQALFTRKLAALCSACGVNFRYGVTIDKLVFRISGALLKTATGSETASADAYVVALGSYSPRLLRPLGIRLPVYPAKGYSATVPLAFERRAAAWR